MNIFDELRAGLRCPGAEDTIRAGRRLADALPPNQIVALSGDLGAGKTTFVKGIGMSLGMDPDEITSPTFTIYAIHQGRMQLLHVDGYRLSGADSLHDLMLEEFLRDPWMIAMEWPERGLLEWMEPDCWRLDFRRNAQCAATISLAERSIP